MKFPTWLQTDHVERTDHALVLTLRIKRNRALWKLFWQHIHAPWYAKVYIVTRAWLKF